MDAQRSVAKRTLKLVSVLVDPVADLGFDEAFAVLRTLVDFDEVEHPSRSNAVYTTSVFCGCWCISGSIRIARWRRR